MTDWAWPRAVVWVAVVFLLWIVVTQPASIASNEQFQQSVRACIAAGGQVIGGNCYR